MDLRCHAVALLALASVTSCRHEPDSIDISVKESGGYLYAVLTNNSGDRIEVDGAAGLGVPPVEGSIQWQVLVDGKHAFPCVMFDHEPKRSTVAPRSSSRFRMKVSDLEWAYCLRSVRPVRYQVAVYYVRPGAVIYSRRVNLVVRPNQTLLGFQQVPRINDGLRPSTHQALKADLMKGAMKTATVIEGSLRVDMDVAAALPDKQDELL